MRVQHRAVQPASSRGVVCQPRRDTDMDQLFQISRSSSQSLEAPQLGLLQSLVALRMHRPISFLPTLHQLPTALIARATCKPTPAYHASTASSVSTHHHKLVCCPVPDVVAAPDGVLPLLIPPNEHPLAQHSPCNTTCQGKHVQHGQQADGPPAPCCQQPPVKSGRGMSDRGHRSEEALAFVYTMAKA